MNGLIAKEALESKVKEATQAKLSEIPKDFEKAGEIIPKDFEKSRESIPKDFQSLESAKVYSPLDRTLREMSPYQPMRESDAMPTLRDMPRNTDWKPEMPTLREMADSIREAWGQKDSVGLQHAFTNHEGRDLRTPVKNGKWSGEVGNSTWLPDKEYKPQVFNPEDKTWGEILEKHKIKEIEFKDGEPDFSKISEASVEVDDFTEKRNINFAKADKELAKQWTQESKDGKEWSAEDVRNYRRENNLTWHERGDMKTMDLASREIHDNTPHSGGISAKKQQL
ncbi:hypothetical protein CQA53_07235 [Helicobacter didelphidarum]|uniref:Uncharacterized protein n=1 Tax=Helicobacter didelphidarum TaxID=2040648 RepID=A0A3D8IK51_9HELI|nr:HNH endonuclease [Helicobacter didelphidarum]RDU64941.1 hypothetical protein CQA53_07235 [Helicobacter didelphidarum]